MSVIDNYNVATDWSMDSFNDDLFGNNDNGFNLDNGLLFDSLIDDGDFSTDSFGVLQSDQNNWTDYSTSDFFANDTETNFSNLTLFDDDAYLDFGVNTNGSFASIDNNSNIFSPGSTLFDGSSYLDFGVNNNGSFDSLTDRNDSTFNTSKLNIDQSISINNSVFEQITPDFSSFQDDSFSISDISSLNSSFVFEDTIVESITPNFSDIGNNVLSSDSLSTDEANTLNSYNGDNGHLFSKTLDNHFSDSAWSSISEGSTSDNFFNDFWQNRNSSFRKDMKEHDSYKGIASAAVNLDLPETTFLPNVVGLSADARIDSYPSRFSPDGEPIAWDVNKATKGHVKVGYEFAPLKNLMNHLPKSFASTFPKVNSFVKDVIRPSTVLRFSADLYGGEIENTRFETNPVGTLRDVNGDAVTGNKIQDGDLKGINFHYDSYIGLVNSGARIESKSYIDNHISTRTVYNDDGIPAYNIEAKNSEIKINAFRYGSRISPVKPAWASDDLDAGSVLVITPYDVQGKLEQDNKFSVMVIGNAEIVSDTDVQSGKSPTTKLMVVMKGEAPDPYNPIDSDFNKLLLIQPDDTREEAFAKNINAPGAAPLISLGAEAITDFFTVNGTENMSEDALQDVEQLVTGIYEGDNPLDNKDSAIVKYLNQISGGNDNYSVYLSHKVSDNTNTVVDVTGLYTRGISGIKGFNLWPSAGLAETNSRNITHDFYPLHQSTNPEVPTYDFVKEEILPQL